ncbi:uncharacterized protein LOC127246621 [Andrographis paniculata]|uniref:uncharacterized protein LOC127246621 n=1 Tax=Andrographis paniculata TaxID=175694 RepID=UPI0021E7B0AD|nr:uncharacterized protein LOC127246621 [Andrographis paniculata]XP_051124048.1 uncharacterized protein LOC127246621 [Andrographis paniculata]
MFKKAIEVKSQQRLSGADRKKLKRAIRERFPNASDADIDILLPPKVEITVSKYPNRILVYALEGDCPMFYDIDGRGSELFPTVFALWKVPHLLPAFLLKGAEVSRFVLGGADLMFPGIQIHAESLPSFSAGEPWTVKVPGNPAPIAVGTTTMSSTEALKAGLRGKALKIGHYYHDSLWELAEKCCVPNAGFLQDIVLEDPALSSPVKTSDSCDDDSLVKLTNVIEHMPEASTTDGASTIPDYADMEDPIVMNGVSEQITTAMVDLKFEESGLCVGSSLSEQHPLSVEDMDMLLDKCLLQALHTTVKDKDLPIPGSILWSSHVLPCRPSGITLDIKKSSYKKLSKWLQSKSVTGVISVKEDKHKKEVSLVAVNRNHSDYLSFKPEKKKVDKHEQSATSAASEGQPHKLFDVVELYKPNVHVNSIFSAIGADTGKLYNASEASQVVFGYIEKEKLAKQAEKSVVILDATLCDALFKGTIKKGGMYPTEIHKKDIGPIFVSRMQAHHVVTRGSDTVVRKGSLKPLQIVTERRQGNKKVTKLSGLESFLIDAETLASELQKKFACSTTVSELPGKKGLEVLVQGGVIDDLARHLVEQYGIQKRYIEVLDKTKK